MEKFKSEGEKTKDCTRMGERKKRGGDWVQAQSRSHSLLEI